jgi:polar amino acid transport system substrate-binding protein
VAFDTVGALVDGAKAGAWDIAFLGSEPARERDISFTAAYLEIEATYLVKAESALRNASEVDREGITVAAPARANYELFLSRTLQRAKLRSMPNGAAAQDLVLSGQVDALAGLKEALLALADRLPGLRLLEGRFMGVQQSIGVPKGRDAGLNFLKHIVEESKASGLVARAIERTGARGVTVAPAAA